MRTLPSATLESLSAAVAPFSEVLALASAVALLSGLAAYAGWLMNESARREAAATAMFARLLWWGGYIRLGWEQRLDRLEELLGRDEATPLHRP